MKPKGMVKMQDLSAHDRQEVWSLLRFKERYRKHLENKGRARRHG